MKYPLFALPLVLLTACVKGPDYERPEVGNLLGLNFKRGTKTPQLDQPLPDEWWRVFGSSRLNGLVADAISNNQDLAAAQARVETSRALVGVKRADWFPRLNFGGDISKQRQSESSFGANLPPEFGSVTDLVSRENYRAALDMSYELDLWGRVKRGVQSASASAKAADENLSAQRLIIAAEVARNYFLLRSLDDQIKVLKDTINLRGEALKLQQSRFDGGLANEMDVTRSRTEVELAKADLTVTERQRGSTENALAVLCGRSPASFTIASTGALTTPPRLPSLLPSTLLQSRPDIRAAEAELQAASAEIGVAQASFYPAFSLLGSGGLESVAARDFLKWENRVLSIGPSVSLPVFQGGRLKANLRAAQSRYDEALAKYRQTILNALRDVEDAMLDLQAYGVQRSALAAAESAAVETRSLANTRHEKGLATYFEVVDADRTVLSTRLALTQIDGQRYISTVLLAKALGGGWKRSAPPPVTPKSKAP
jgi:outer membrane protein, multidrug efflux system